MELRKFQFLVFCLTKSIQIVFSCFLPLLFF
nr:MAG TPA: hypothetical protein [Caudoviricetes sp.]